LANAEAEDVQVGHAVSHCIQQGLYEEAADALAEGMGTRSFEDAIHVAYYRDVERARELTAVDLLPYLPASPVITTNFDPILRFGSDQAGTPYESVRYGDEADAVSDAIRTRKRILLKLHGDVQDRQYRILTQQEYRYHYGSLNITQISYDKVLPQLLRNVFRTRPLLF
jgi:hypothetical protein